LHALFSLGELGLRNSKASKTVPGPDPEVKAYQLRVRDFYLPYLTLRSDRPGRPRKIDRYGYASLPSLALDERRSAHGWACMRLRRKDQGMRQIVGRLVLTCVLAIAAASVVTGFALASANDVGGDPQLADISKQVGDINKKLRE